MALARVQGTAKVVASGATSVSITFSTLPVVGNGIIVPVIGYNPAFASGSCSDNQGNTYQLAITQADGPPRIAIYYCSAITTSSGTFTVTVNSGFGYYVASIIEISGMDASPLDKTASGSANNANPITGTTAALTADEELLISVFSTLSGFASSTVTTGWTQEAEELNGANATGESDSRIIASALGTTQSCNWTLSGGVGWVAAIATFKGTAAAAVSAVESIQFSVVRPD